MKYIYKSNDSIEFNPKSLKHFIFLQSKKDDNINVNHHNLAIKFEYDYQIILTANDGIRTYYHIIQCQDLCFCLSNLNQQDIYQNYLINKYLLYKLCILYYLNENLPFEYLELYYKPKEQDNNVSNLLFFQVD